MSPRVTVHPTAVVDPGAVLEDDVEVGPYAIVGPKVRVGRGCKLASHVVLEGWTTIGEANVFHPFCVVGGRPQMKKALKKTPKKPELERRSGDGPELVIGAHNVFREHVTVNVASGAQPTTIGSHNLLMTGAHVAHDVVMGSHCVVANGVQLAGHVVVEDWVTFGGGAGVGQWRRVGESAFVAAGAMCERDVPPFVIVQGDRARVRGLNVVGLERREVPARSIARLKHAFARLFLRPDVAFASALAELDMSDPFVERLARALRR